MKRLTLVIDDLGVGGGQQVVRLTACQLASLGWQIQVISLQNDPDATIAQELSATPGVTVIHFPGQLKTIPRYFKISKQIKTFHTDIVQTHLCYANVVGVISAKMANVPVIGVLHSQGICNYAKPVLRHFATAIEAVGIAVEEYAVSFFKNKKITTISNCVIIPALPDKKEIFTVRAELGLPQDVLVAAALGRLSKEKNYPNMIRGFSIVVQKFPSARLIIFGSGEMKEQLVDLIHQLHMDDQIILFGSIKNSQHWLAAADLYILSSQMEGLPLALLEAMSVGLPVVATDVGDLRNVISQDCGSMVPSNDPNALASEIIRFFSDESLRKKAGERSREIISTQYNPEIWTEKLNNFFLEVIKNYKN